MKWIFDRERGKDEESALCCIEKALGLLKKHFSASSDSSSIAGGTVTVAMSMHSLLTSELMKLRCEFTVKAFCALHSSHSSYSSSNTTSNATTSFFLNHLSNPPLLLRLIMEAALTLCWGRQMEALYSALGYATRYALKYTYGFDSFITL